MRNALLATIAVFALVGPATAQSQQDHQQHHPTGSPTTQAQPTPAQPAGTPQPQAQVPTGQPMQNMPEQCRTMMQNMPQNCMGMMQQMMQGGMMRQGGMMQGQSSQMASHSEAAKPTWPPWTGCMAR